MNFLLKAPALTVMPFSLSFHECFLYRLLTSLRGGSCLAFHIQTPASDPFFCPDPFQEWFPGLTFTQHPLAVLHKQHRQKSLLRSNLCANSHLLYTPYLKHLYTISSAQGFTFLHLTSCFTLLQLLDTQCWCRSASPSLSVTAPDCMYSLLTLWDEKIRL